MEEGNENIPEAHRAGWEIESVAESRQDDSATQAGLGGRRKELAHRRITLEQENNKNQGAGDRIQSSSGPSRTEAPAQNSVSAQWNPNLTSTTSSASTYSLTLNSKRTVKALKRGKQSR